MVEFNEEERGELPMPPDQAPPPIRRLSTSGRTSLHEASLTEQVKGFKRTTGIALVALLVNITTLVLCIVIVPGYTITISAVLGLLAAVLALCSASVDYRLCKQNFAPTPQNLLLAHRQKYVKQVVVLLSFVACIAALVLLTLTGIHWDTTVDRFYLLNNRRRLAVATFASVATLCNAGLGFTIARLTWSPFYRAARSSMILTSSIQFALGSMIIVANREPFIIGSGDHRTNPFFSFFQHVGSILSCVSVLGFAICITLREGNRINQLLTGFIEFYVLVAAISFILCFIVVIMSLVLLTTANIKNTVVLSTLMGDPVLAGCAVVCFIINFVAANHLQSPPPSNLLVEPFDLSQLTPKQREAYAQQITRFGKLTPGAPSGEAAISLMQAYAEASLPGMTCTVLRVYRPPRNVNKIMRLMSQGRTWEEDRAWLLLDDEQMVLRESPDINVEEEEKVSSAPKKLSRYQQKKMAKKQAKGGTPVPLRPGTIGSLQDMKAEVQFAAQLESTEALVLLTTFNNYDLSSSVNGVAGRVLRRTLGGQSLFKPLVVRLGLLGFHWPFRESTFYCSHAKRPVARSAAVLRAIDEWNVARPKADRLSVLLDPTFEHEANQRAIIPSGWMPTPLPASHVIDLRPHKGKTLQQYLKSIKYRDQEVAFKKAGGTVEESNEFTPEECAEAMRLWHQIAEKRTSGGETSVLAEPNEDFLQQLGRGGTKDRTLMFLKAKGQTVATCMLFRLGDTITSDLQGLDYEHGRPLKAYFVMMQHVIAIALREGFSFVDFGPTTAKPKMDIGCKSVPLVGAMTALSPFISMGVRIAMKDTRDNMKNGTGDSKEKEDGNNH